MNICIRANQSATLGAFDQTNFHQLRRVLVDPLYIALDAPSKFANRHFARANLPRALLEATYPVQHWDTDPITWLRACVPQPEHRE